MIGIKGAKLGAVRIAGGAVGAAIMAMALPATNGAGPSGSVAPKQADAAVSCNNFKVFTQGFGNQRRFAAVPVNHGSTNCLLANGNRQGGVGVLQSALNRCYGQHLKVDGVYGRDTVQAVKFAQGRAHVSQDGVYGPRTARAIKWPFERDASPLERPGTQTSCEQLGLAR